GRSLLSAKRPETAIAHCRSPAFRACRWGGRSWLLHLHNGINNRERIRNGRDVLGGWNTQHGVDHVDGVLQVLVPTLKSLNRIRQRSEELSRGNLHCLR